MQNRFGQFKVQQYYLNNRLITADMDGNPSSLDTKPPLGLDMMSCETMDLVVCEAISYLESHQQADSIDWNDVSSRLSITHGAKLMWTPEVCRDAWFQCSRRYLNRRHNDVSNRDTTWSAGDQEEGQRKRKRPSDPSLGDLDKIVVDISVTDYSSISSKT